MTVFICIGIDWRRKWQAFAGKKMIFFDAQDIFALLCTMARLAYFVI